MSILFALSALAAVPQQADAPAPKIGEEVNRIAFAARNIRDWQDGPDDSSVYMRVNGRWYLVRLSGPCLSHVTSPQLLFETSAGGAFDRFSKVAVARQPGLSCGVDAIYRSEDPRVSHDKD